MRFHRLHCLLAAIVLVAGSNLAHAQLTITPEKPDGVYQVGDTIRWHIQWVGQTPLSDANYVLTRGALTELKKEPLTLTDGKAMVEAKLDKPGTLLLEVKAKSADDKPQTALGGAVAAPEKIQPSAPRPADFDAFWDAKLKELSTIPANPHLEPAPSDKPAVDYWKVTLDNIHGTHIQGQLARPKTPEKLPAMLIVQWAGVYGLQRATVTNRAADGWLVLNINAHDLPIDQPESFYKQQADGPLKNYPAIGNDDRDTSYFLRMYLACYQAAQYLVDRPDWDGKTLVVMGTSQGGQQTLIAAALHPRITAAIACVPAGCDMLGPDVGRKSGWPGWYGQTTGKDSRKVHEASRYYDVVNFAPRIKCPTLIALGLIDQTCPPAGVLAAANQITAPKEIVIEPQSDHKGPHAAHDARAKAWLTELKQGKPAPVQP